jgi:phosphoglycerate dehydrogenase-like enzyme
MKIVSRGPLDPEQVRGIIPEANIILVDNTDDLFREARDAEVVLGIGPDRFPELLRSGSALRWVHTSIAGVDRFICDELRQGNIILTCAKDGPAGPNLADHAMALLLALSRNIGRSARAATWRRKEFSEGVFELGGRTACIAGFGAAGREITRRALAFRMKVVSTKLREPYGVFEGAAVSPPASLSKLVEQSDVIFNTLPGTPDTTWMFNADLFSRFKKNSIFINVGRGTTVDTAALLDALKDGIVGAAGLDVIDPEPLPDGHPLWSMENVIISPHIAGAAKRRSFRNEQLIFENLRRLAADEPLKSRVDPEVGY